MNDDWAVKMGARLRRQAQEPPSGETLRPHVEAVVRRAAAGGRGRVSVQANDRSVTVTATGQVSPAVRAELRRAMPSIRAAVKADVERQLHS